MRENITLEIQIQTQEGERALPIEIWNLESMRGKYLHFSWGAMTTEKSHVSSAIKKALYMVVHKYIDMVLCLSDSSC